MESASGPYCRLHTQNIVFCRKCDRGLPSAESERIRFQDIDLHITKACFPEALWQCAWIHYHHCVEEVKQTK